MPAESYSRASLTELEGREALSRGQPARKGAGQLRRLVRRAGPWIAVVVVALLAWAGWNASLRFLESWQFR